MWKRSGAFVPVKVPLSPRRSRWPTCRSSSDGESGAHQRWRVVPVDHIEEIR
jgi:hypothetical protein